VLVVLDTNAFHSDVHGTQPRLSGILDGPLNQAAFEVFVPEVVMLELDKQFARRSKKLVREIDKAVGAHKGELAALGIAVPEGMTVDEDAVNDYRGRLEERLAKAGAKILPAPEDLSAALEWAVHRRKPFKHTGEGFQDAVIWLSILELASQRPEPIAFVSSNSKDFAEPDSDSKLAIDLRRDLIDRKRPGNQVRLVAGISAFADVVGTTASLEAARKLASAGKFRPAVEGAVLWSRLDRESLAFDIPLDSGPRVTGLDVEELEVEGAADLPGGDILVHVSAKIEVELDLLIDRSEYYASKERIDAQIDWLSVSYDNERYVQAEASATLLMDLTIVSTPDGTTSQTQIDTFSLAPVEAIMRALRGRAGAELVEELRAALDGHTVENYVADEPIESSLDDVSINGVSSLGRVRLVEMVDEDEPCAAVLETSAEVDVEWSSNAPTPFDADRFASLALNENSDAPPILHDVDSLVPIDVHFTARYDDEHGWHDIEFDEVALESEERERRSEEGSPGVSPSVDSPYKSIGSLHDCSRESLHLEALSHGALRCTGFSGTNGAVSPASRRRPA
jgi:hypothetical protein